MGGRGGAWMGEDGMDRLLSPTPGLAVAAQGHGPDSICSSCNSTATGMVAQRASHIS